MPSSFSLSDMDANLDTLSESHPLDNFAGPQPSDDVQAIDQAEGHTNSTKRATRPQEPSTSHRSPIAREIILDALLTAIRELHIGATNHQNLPHSWDDIAGSIARGTAHRLSSSEDLQRLWAVDNNDQSLDSGEEQSWDEDEHDGFYSTYYDLLRYKIHMVSQQPGECFVTSSMPRRQRRTIHSMAHQMHCSHWTMGSKHDRVMIPYDNIGPFRPGDRVTRSCSNKDAVFSIDPYSVNISGIPSHYSIGTLQRAFRVCSAPQPTQLSLHTQESQICATARFEDAEEAAQFVDLMHRKQARGGDFQAVTISYQRERTSAISTSQISQSSTSVQVAQSRGNPAPPPLFRSGSSNFSQDYGSDASFSEAFHGDGAELASATPRSKRTRKPMIRGGYECSYNCGMRFHRYGDRTKHERIHMPRDLWPHQCGLPGCEKRFLERKDLDRHKKKVHGAS